MSKARVCIYSEDYNIKKKMRERGRGKFLINYSYCLEEFLLTRSMGIPVQTRKDANSKISCRENNVGYLTDPV